MESVEQVPQKLFEITKINRDIQKTELMLQDILVKPKKRLTALERSFTPDNLILDYSDTPDTYQ